MYTNIEELVNYVIERKTNNSDIIKILRSPQQTRKIRKILNLLDGENVSKALYGIIMSPQILCECGNNLVYRNFFDGYTRFCNDRKCEFMNIHKKQATIDTFTKIYGCHPMKTEETKNNLKESMIKKYGVENAVHVSIKNGTYINPWSREDVKIKIKATNLIKYGGHPMQNINCHENNLKSRVKFKEYELPSGKIIKLQGYEDRGVEYLLSMFNEDDIIYTVKEINERLGIITYKIILI